MGGGGANLLDSPKIGDNSDFGGIKPDGDLPSEVDDSVTEWTTPTYKSYEDYFTDLNITKETITTSDLTGSGKESDPYIVHSTKGFLYLTNSELSEISLYSRYVKLACDIILNDETFDKDGVPSGGDGVVYEWKSVNAPDMRFDGGFHCIYGMYQNYVEGEVAYGGLFRYDVYVRQIQNLNLANIYVYNDVDLVVYGIAFRVSLLENCKILSGNICNKNGDVFAFGKRVSDIRNCTNYANVSVEATMATGMVRELLTKMENCENYGNISVGNDGDNFARSAGLVYEMWGGSTIENCRNYGNVLSNGHQVGGLVVWGGNDGNIRYCQNYGTIKATQASGGIVAILHGVAGNYKTLTINNCQNYGKIISIWASYANGEIIGQCSNSDGNKTNKRVLVSNCLGASGSGCPIVGVASSNILVKNCKSKQEDISQNGDLYIYATCIGKVVKDNGNLDIAIENFESTICANAITQLYLINTLNGTSVYDINVKLKNVYCKAICNKIQNFAICTTKDLNIILESVLINFKLPQNIDLRYYGTDFSGFYVDWKSGNIGVKALSGSGFFQGKVNEEWLENNGYQKREF